MTTENKDDKNIGSFYMGRGRQPEESRRILPRGALTIMALSIFAVVIWYAYPQNKKAIQEGDVPVITADNAPYRFKPEDPGGMEVRHQDSTVFDPLDNKKIDTVEKLRPPTEQPMNKDKAVALARTQEKPATGDKPAKLDLKMQMKTLPNGTEKIIAAPRVRTGAGVNPVPPASKHPVAPPKVIHLAPVAAAPVAPTVTAKPSVAATGVYVQLGAFRDIDSAHSAWAKLQKKFPQYFAKLTMRTERVDLGSKGVFNRLQAGRLSEEEAKKLCDGLKAAGTAGCIVVHASKAEKTK